LAATHIALIAVFNQHQEVLLLKRGSNVHCPDVWSFPGGKKECGESLLAAATRELQEETGITATQWQYIGHHNHTYTDRRLSLQLFSCQYHHTTIDAESVTQWCKLEKLASLPMPEANQALIRLLTLAHGKAYASKVTGKNR